MDHHLSTAIGAAQSLSSRPEYALQTGLMFGVSIPALCADRVPA